MKSAFEVRVVTSELEEVINSKCSVCGTTRGLIYEFGDFTPKKYAKANIKWVALDTGLQCGPPRIPFYTCNMCHMLHYVWPSYFLGTSPIGTLPKSKFKLKCLKMWKALRRFFFDQRS